MIINDKLSKMLLDAYKDIQIVNNILQYFITRSQAELENKFSEFCKNKKINILSKLQ